MFQFSDLSELLAQYLSPNDGILVARAFELAARAHDGQFRFTGEPYISHPLEVARILASMRMDKECVIAGLLHDTIEDAFVTKAQLLQQFGAPVADLVDGVSKLTQFDFSSKAERQAENFRKMMLAMAKDIRVIIVKLADRLHNMRTLIALPPEKRRRIARETLEIYAPIASRLGMNRMRIEFEDLGFHALYPSRYRVLKEAVRRARGNRKEVLQKIETSLMRMLEQHHMPNARVWGREKHLYSLYRKMVFKGLSFSEVMDVYAFRVVVDSIDSCYRVLGIVHSLYKPILGRFKDYIAIQKANGYQSLHTTLLGPHGFPIELQIRTESMDRLAENGISTHWLYKEKQTDDHQSRTQHWLNDLLEIQENTHNALEFIENIKIDLYPDEVYVFTPKGKILSLPDGATPIDFAFAVHTDIGLHCVAAKIDRKLVPLSTPLASGQTVEIITTANSHPHPSWLSLAVTGKARSNIRAWLKDRQRTEAKQLGRSMVEKALQNIGSTLDALTPNALRETLHDLKVEKMDALFEDVGLGRQHSGDIAEKLLGVPNAPKQDAATLSIQGASGTTMSFARCCCPIPGDAVVGYVVPDQGIVVHLDQCSALTQLRHHADRFVYVTWDDKVDGVYSVELKVDVLNAKGVLATVAQAISDANANIATLKVDERDGRHHTLWIMVEVHNRAHLARLIRKLKNLSTVTSVARKTRPE